MATPNSNSSWQDLTRRAAAEVARPSTDVVFSVRKQIEAERTSPQRATCLLDEITRLWGMPALGATVAATLLLGWQLAPAVREVAIAIEFQTQFLAGL
jgi:hypothetical protein